MTEIPFNYPSVFWLIPAALVFAVIGFALFRKVQAGLFIAVVALFPLWFGFQSFLHSYTEEWLSKQRVYAILFKDFPQDKERFISEYTQAFILGGGKAVARKHEEMKIIMMVNHVKHYIENAPSALLTQYITAEAWLLNSLNSKNPVLCQRYLADSSVFEDVRNLVGDDIFLRSISYNPQMIVGAVDKPEPVSDSDRMKAAQLYWNMKKTLQATGVSFKTDNNKVLSCDTSYRQFYALSQMPAHDAALIVKYLYSEGNLKGKSKSNWLEKLLPF